jgi:uncharacterized protein YdeI (YjbR/CyaY-like superfamily)
VHWHFLKKAVLKRNIYGNYSIIWSFKKTSGVKSMTSGEFLCISSREEWRDWLMNNHSSVEEIWLLFYKNHLNEPNIQYYAAVEEAICFGWIDSLIKNLDENRYARKFTPRNGKAVWSTVNKVRAEKMIGQGRMTATGLNLIREAKSNGRWNDRPAAEQDWEIPLEFQEALNNNPPARRNFENLAPSYKKQFVGWIASAKMSETRCKRAAFAIERLERNEKLGLI